jgi:hypothetical protein
MGGCGVLRNRNHLSTHDSQGGVSELERRPTKLAKPTGLRLLLHRVGGLAADALPMGNVDARQLVAGFDEHGGTGSHDGYDQGGAGYVADHGWKSFP